MINEKDVFDALKKVTEPDLGKNIVELDLVTLVSSSDKSLSLRVETKNAAMHARKRMKEACQFAKEKAINKILSEVSPVEVKSNEQLTCFQGVNIPISKHDLVAEQQDGKVCKRVYFDARIRNTLGKVWGYHCR